VKVVVVVVICIIIHNNNNNKIYIVHICINYMAKHNFRGEFRVQNRITTTLSPELQLLAHKKAIRWSEALEVGIKKLAYVEVKPFGYDETIINETELNKTEQLQRAVKQLQEHINVLDKEKGN